MKKNLIWCPCVDILDFQLNYNVPINIKIDLCCFLISIFIQLKIHILHYTQKKNTNSKYLNKWKQICKLPAVVI